MPRKIVFHAGFHKTGTSSVQAVLRANRKALNKVLAIRLKGQMTELMRATRGYSSYRDPWSMDKVTRRFEALLRDLPAMPKRTLLISAEELSGHMPGRGDLADYTAAAELMQTYLHASRAAFPKAELVAYYSTRAPGSWLRSSWAEHVKSSSLTLSFDAFAARFAPAADLAKTVRQVQDHCDCAVHSAALEDCKTLALGPADPVLDLCDIPDPLRATLIAVPPENRALDEATTLQLLDANRRFSDKAARSAAKRAILDATKGETP